MHGDFEDAASSPSPSRDRTSGLLRGFRWLKRSSRTMGSVLRIGLLFSVFPLEADGLLKTSATTPEKGLPVWSMSVDSRLD